jgi:hypothetical protein
VDLSDLEPKSRLSKIGEEDTPPEEANTTAAEVKPEEVAVPTLAKTPHEEWLEEIEEIKLTKAEAARIVDSILSKGHYEEAYKVNKTMFALRTRSTADADRAMEILHEQKPSSTAHYSHLVSRINLASSLVKFGSSTFPHTAPASNNRDILDKEWRERYRFITSLPAPIFYLLSQVLQKFDQKVALAGDARSIENF